MGLFGIFRGKRTVTLSSPLPEHLAIAYNTDGRCYRADVPYYLPQDAQENQRLDYQDYIFRKILGGLCFAPVEAVLKRGCNVLDVGSGSNHWAYDLAYKYKHTHVEGF